MLKYVIDTIETVMLKPGYIDKKEFDKMKTASNMESVDIRIRTQNLIQDLVDSYSKLDVSIRNKISSDIDSILMCLDKIFVNHASPNYIHDMEMFMTTVMTNIFDQYVMIPTYRKIFKDPIIRFRLLPTFIGIDQELVKHYRCLLKQEIESEMKTKIFDSFKIFQNKFTVYFVSPQKLNEIVIQYKDQESIKKINDYTEKKLISSLRKLREKNLLTKKQFSTFCGMIRRGYIDNPRIFIDKMYRKYFSIRDYIISRQPDKSCTFQTGTFIHAKSPYIYLNAMAEKCFAEMKNSIHDPLIYEKVNDKLTFLNIAPHFTDVLCCYKSVLTELTNEFEKARDTFDYVSHIPLSVEIPTEEKLNIPYYDGEGSLPLEIKEIFDGFIYDAMEFDLYKMQIDMIKN